MFNNSARDSAALDNYITGHYGEDQFRKEYQQMLSSTIRHGDLVIDIEPNGDVQIVRQSNSNAIRLSKSEFAYIVEFARIFDWPISGPIDPALKDIL